jgi:Putative transposase
VLAYLARYTHRVAISNSRLIGLDERGVTFRYKDYRRNGRARYGNMTLAPDEFIRRFLLHVLPKGFHRIRHYGLLASSYAARHSGWGLLPKGMERDTRAYGSAAPGIFAALRSPN